MRRSHILLSSFSAFLLLLGAGCSGSGLNTISSAPKDCGTDLTCFDKYFKDCKPAMQHANVGTEIVDNYEIVGPKEGKCEIKKYFSKNPLPSYVGKEAFCLYDNSKKFADAAQDIIKSGRNLPDLCQGPLIDEMYKGVK